MEVDPQVKKELEENEAPSKTLAPSTPKPIPSSSSGERKEPVVTREKLLWVKKSRSGSKSKSAVGELAGKHTSCKQKKATTRSTGEAKSAAVLRAEEVQSNLESELPSFVKSMVRSHVISCFWMGLPVPFCKSYLPRRDSMFTLENETGGRCEVKFIAEKTGLSAGWRQFSADHRLLVGDALVFQLVEPFKFKVYIIRANDLNEVDGALNLLNLDAQKKENGPFKSVHLSDIGQTDAVACNSTKRKRHPKSLPIAVVRKIRKMNKKTGLPRMVNKLRKPSVQPENDSENVSSEVVEGSPFSGPGVQFGDIVNYDNFHILVNGLHVNSEQLEGIRTKYYKLCCSQNAYLHDHLIKGLSLKLIAAIISENVNIADAIRSCKLTTLQDEFATWDKTLKAFEILGMNVKFLLARLSHLVSLSFESEGAMARKKYVEAMTKQSRAKDEIRNLVAKLMELEEGFERSGADIETLKSKAESYELKFQEEVAEPW